MKRLHYVSVEYIKALQVSGASATVIEAAMRGTLRAHLGDEFPAGSPFKPLRLSSPKR